MWSDSNVIFIGVKIVVMPSTVATVMVVSWVAVVCMCGMAEMLE